MRRAFFATVLSIAVAGAWLALAGTTTASPEHERFQPWGTWAWSTQRPVGGALPALITYNKDGTLTGSDGVMYGLNYPPAVIATKESGLHGVWERTGPHEFRGTSLWLQFDPNGNAIGWGRSRSDLEFVDADHITGTMWLDSLPCPTPFTCPDPVDTQWTSAVTVRAVSAVRLTRVEPPGYY